MYLRLNTMRQKDILLLVLGLLFSRYLNAQLAYRDAIAFSRSVVEISPDSAVLPIGQDAELKNDIALQLRYYLPAPLNTLRNSDSILQFFLIPGSEFYNPILAELFPPLTRDEIADTTFDIGPATESSRGLFDLGGLGGLPVTNIADGLARFLVKRSKQELNQAFFRKFYMALEDPRFVEFGILYPQTYQVFATADRDVYRYNYFMESMQEAFRVDIKTIPQNLAVLIQHPKYEPRFKQPFVRSLTSLALVSSQEVIEGNSPRDAFSHIANSDLWMVDTIEAPVFNLKASFQLMDLLSQSLRTEQTEGDVMRMRPEERTVKVRNWISRDNLNKLLSTESQYSYALKIFMGLLYHQAGHISFVNKDNEVVPLRKYLEEINKAQNRLGNFRTYVRNFGTFIVDLDQQIKDTRLQGESETGPNTATYYRFANAFTHALEEGIKFKTQNLGLTSPYDSVFINVVNHANHLGLDIKLKNYSSAVINMVQVLQSATAGSEFEFKSDLVRYSSFIASVANAASSEEIAYAIEAIALPVGSSAIKKYSSWNLALQAYVGGFYGIETLKGIPNSNQGGQVFGMTAPVGIAVSRGLDPFHDAGSLTLFASLIDIGAVTAFRFQDPDAETLPEITLSNIYAPGAYLIYGFPRWPVSLGLGAQMGPQLRQVALDGNLVGVSGFRTSAFLAVDIPIFNLYTSMR